MTAAETLTLLLRLEWAGHQQLFVCPSCGANRMMGRHEPRCELAKAITDLHADNQ
jgi:hypothetical protein